MPTKPSRPKTEPKGKVLKDPKGGLTQAGRDHFKETEGANLKPGVKGPANTPEKQKRKGSFLRRHFANPNAGPLTDDKGDPTRHALSAAAWGEPVPKTEGDVKKLAAKGSELLEQYHEGTEGKAKSKTKAKAAPKKSATDGGEKAPAATKKKAAASKATAAKASKPATKAKAKAKE